MIEYTKFSIEYYEIKASIIIQLLSIEGNAVHVQFNVLAFFYSSGTNMWFESVIVSFLLHVLVVEKDFYHRFSIDCFIAWYICVFIYCIVLTFHSRCRTFYFEHSVNTKSIIFILQDAVFCCVAYWNLVSVIFMDNCSYIETNNKHFEIVIRLLF